MIGVVGILGMGSIGQRHARNCMSLGVQVLAHDPADPMSHTEDFVLKNADALLICSPTKFHMHQLVDAGQQVKAIMVEKPIAYDAPPEYVLGVLQGLQMRGVSVATGYNLRFHSVVKRMKEIIDRGDLGRIHWADFTVGQITERPEYLRDGVTLNWSHEIDLPLHLFGPAVLKGSDIVGDNDYCAKLLLRHERGTTVSVHMDYVTGPEIRNGVISGTDMRLHYDLVARTLKIVRPNGSHVTEVFDDTWDANYLDELTSFLASADGYPSQTLATGYDGYHAYKIAYEALNVREK